MDPYGSSLRTSDGGEKHTAELLEADLTTLVARPRTNLSARDEFRALQDGHELRASRGAGER